MKYLIFFVLLFSSMAVSGQSSQRDSLMALLSKATEDTIRVNLLLQLSDGYSNTNPDSAFLFANEGLKIAQSSAYLKGEIRCKENLAGYWWAVGDYATAVKLLLQVLEFHKSQNDQGMISKTYSGLLNSYRDQGDLKEALHYSSLILQAIPPQFDFVIGIANAMKGSVYYEMNSLDSAQFYLTKALQYPNSLGKGWIMLINGRLYTKINKTDTALNYFRQAIDLLRDDTNYKNLAGAYISTGELFEQIGKSDSAIYYARQGLAIAEKKNFNKETLQAYQLLSTAYEKVNINTSLQYYKLAIIRKDSLFNQEKQKQLLSYKFNEELRQNEIKNNQQQSKNKNRILILLVLLTCFVLFIIFLVRNNRHKQKLNSQLQKQKEEIQSTFIELKQTQAQLIQKEKLASLGELTAGIAHEIQNPLNFVNNFAELSVDLAKELKDETEKPEIDKEIILELASDLHQNQEKIHLHGQRASSIVKGMLEHSRTSTGEKELTDINALAEEYLRLSYHGFRTKDKSFNASFTTDFDPNLPRINVIPQDIGRVFLNLINNAFQACSASGTDALHASSSLHADPLHADPLEKGVFNAPRLQSTVSISTRKANDNIEIRVTDNGPGIPEEIKDKIFQPFFTTKPTGEGTGLGLSLAYDIVKAHGGEIKVESFEGEGASFIIQLPIN